MTATARSAHANAQTLFRLFEAFDRLDFDAMAACYAPNARFGDPVFRLRGSESIGGMWRMLCEAAAQGRSEWSLRHREVRADETRGAVQWEARYRFSTTGRPVLNKVHSRFVFSPEGLIVAHTDRFIFWSWAKQALGPIGLLLGWTPWLRGKVRQNAAMKLADSMRMRIAPRGD